MSIGEIVDEEPFVEKFWRDNNLNQRTLTVLLAPFTTGKNRNWESDRMALFADTIHDRFQSQFVMTCGQKDLQAAKELAGMAKKTKIVLAEQTTLRQYIALLRNSDIIVCMDSSAMHIAGALQKPFVALFGVSPVDERFPLDCKGVYIYKPIHCSPCDLPYCKNKVFRECMKQIEVNEVVNAFIKVKDSMTMMSEIHK
jgi:ADP-heptose:LPS heptosyltransferase